MTDQLSARVFPKLYRDSVTLMALASAAQRIDGVRQVGAVMATPANLAILRESGMLPPEISPAPDDLLVVVRADGADAGDAAVAVVEAGLTSAETTPGTASTFTCPRRLSARCPSSYGSTAAGGPAGTRPACRCCGWRPMAMRSPPSTTASVSTPPFPRRSTT